MLGPFEDERGRAPHSDNRKAGTRRPRRWWRGVAAAAVLALASGCGAESPSDPAPPTDVQLRIVEVAVGLEQPVHLAAPPGDPRLFVVEQPGRIRIIENGQLLATPFLDLRDRVVDGGERGLLSLAFHPDFADNGRFFVDYTGAGGHTRIEEYRVTADRNRADPASARLLLAIEQPFANHNGGQLAFGPDGMLYIGMGDGGSAGDPQGHGQNRGTLLGALLRIDVDRGTPYAVPPDNAFVGDPEARPEIWAIGLRNPWRFSFDVDGGMLYVADVGQNRMEEVNAVRIGEAGLNYGWNVMEGTLCFRPATACPREGLVPPVVEYSRSEGCSVTGGHVYRGAEMPELVGHYFYSDYCAGELRSFRLTADGVVADAREWDVGNLGSVTSFGVDAAGELYVVTHQGRILRLSR